MPNQPRQHVHRLGLDTQLLVFRTEESGDLPRVPSFVVLGDIEADGERLDPARLLCHSRNYGARIHPSREKGPERHVATEAQAGGLEQVGADQLMGLRLFADVARPVGQAPVAIDAYPPLPPDERVSRRQLA